MSGQDIYTILRNIAELGEAALTDYEDGEGQAGFYSIAYGDEAQLDIQMDPALAYALGMEYDDERNNTLDSDNTGQYQYITYRSLRLQTKKKHPQTNAHVL